VSFAISLILQLLQSRIREFHEPKRYPRTYGGKDGVAKPQGKQNGNLNNFSHHPFLPLRCILNDSISPMPPKLPHQST
jgi:hypothetical protein